MSRLILANPSRDDVLSEADLSAALGDRGYDVEPADADTVWTARDCVLVLGRERWWTTDVRRTLETARARGCTTILWQLEPLLPPTTSERAAGLVRTLAEGRLRDAAHAESATRWARDAVRFQMLSALTRRESWHAAHLTAHVFKYPTEQTRAVVTFARAGLFDRVLVSLAPRKTLLASFGIDSCFVPVGYTAAFGHTRDMAPRDIDVLFLGKLSTRRRRLLARIERQITAAGLTLHIVDRDCYGDERTQLLNRTKVVLNLLKFPWEFPGMRLLMAASCGALVVSEGAPDTAPYVAGRHFIAAPLDRLGETLIENVRDAATRQAIVAEAHEHVTRTLALGPVLSAAMI